MGGRNFRRKKIKLLKNLLQKFNFEQKQNSLPQIGKANNKIVYIENNILIINTKKRKILRFKEKYFLMENVYN